MILTVFFKVNKNAFQSYFARKIFGFCCHGTFVFPCNVLASLNIFTFSGVKRNGDDDDDGISNT